MIRLSALRECVRTAQAALTAAPGGGFDLLFGWMARRIALEAGLDPCWALTGFSQLTGALPAGLEERLSEPTLSLYWQQEETLGWAYQLWNEPLKSSAFTRLYRERQKISLNDLPVVTQLFTPNWIARYLVENTLGRLWMDLHPDSRLHIEMTTLLPVAGDDTHRNPPRLLRQIHLYDPACGTMHFGLAAIPLLERMYAEEQEHAGRPGWPEQPSLEDGQSTGAVILANNLFGSEIDPRALRLAAAALAIRAARTGGDLSDLPAAHLELLPSPLGSLQRSPGEPSFDCVVANPPYMIARNMPPELAAFLRLAYPSAWRDLYSAFILRALERTCPGGYTGLLTQQSFMHLRSFASLRGCLLSETTIQSVLLTGTGTFPGVSGEKVNTGAYVLRRSAPNPEARPVCIRVERCREAQARQAAFHAAADDLRQGNPTPPWVYTPRQSSLTGLPWAWWAPEGVLRALRTLPSLADMPGTDGNKTGRNDLYIRLLCDVPPDEVAAGRWRVLARPARQIPYRQQFDQVVDWSPEARAFYRANAASSPLPDGLLGLAGISWSRVATRRFNARSLPAGVIPDVSTPAIYPPEADRAYLLALLNARPARCFLRVLNPTINYALGDVRRLPLPPASPAQKQALAALAQQAETAAAAWDGPLSLAAQALAAIEARIDALAYQLYEFTEEEIAIIEREIQP